MFRIFFGGARLLLGILSRFPRDAVVSFPCKHLSFLVPRSDVLVAKDIGPVSPSWSRLGGTQPCLFEGEKPGNPC